MRRTRTWAPLAAVAAGLMFAAPASAGGLAQLEGTDGCLSFDGADIVTPGACGSLPALVGPRGMAVSPDGRNVYVAAQGASALLVLTRDPVTGVLAPLPGLDGCLSYNGTNRVDSVQRCRVGRAVSGARHVTVSPDGASVYLTAGSGSPGGGVDAVSIFSRDAADGSLSQLPGTAGCLTLAPDVGESGCGGLPEGVSLTDAYDVTVSPDGDHVYVGTFNLGSSVYTFGRGTDGALDFSSCVRHRHPGHSASPPCESVFGLEGLRSITVSPDGDHVYTTASGFFFSPNNAVGIFARSGDGRLEQTGCISEDGSFGGVAAACADGRALRGAYALELTPDGEHAYVRSSSGIAVFARDDLDGGLAQADGTAGCSTADGEDGDGTPGVCAVARGVDRTGSFGGLAITPDGDEVYSAVGGIPFFDRDASSGALSQLDGELACIHQQGTNRGCALGRGMHNPYEIVVSPDGRHAYASATGQDAIAVFERRVPPACEDAARSVGYQTQVTIPLSCTDENGDELTLRIVDGPSHGTLGEVDQAAGTVTYSPANGYRGPDDFTFAANDGVFDSNVAGIAITVQPRPSLLGPICRATLGEQQPLCDTLP